MTEYELAMHAVLADPENDAPRLAFAKLVRDSDPDRAAFIEQQVESARKARERGDTRDTISSALSGAT